MSQPAETASLRDLPAWKHILSVSCAVLLALLFLVSGLWKITDPFGAAARMAQAQVPASLSMAAALGFGVAEVFSGILLLVPRFRRWGAWLCGLMLVAFLVFFAIHYQTLRGEDCSCFPWLQRVVGPWFFISDGIMLLMAVAAGWWAEPSRSLRSALLALSAVAVFAAVCYGVVAVRESGIQAPDSITAGGQTVRLSQGRYFLYFFDPECSHCERAAREMSAYRWKGVELIAIPTRMPQFAEDFLRVSNLQQVKVSPDVEKLRQVFQFGDPPYGVLLEDGRQRAAIAIWDDQQPPAILRRNGFIE